MLLILLVQTEPDLWHYIDDVLVTELLFGEEYQLMQTGDITGTAHRRRRLMSQRRLKAAAKSKSAAPPAKSSSSSSSTSKNHGAYNHTSGNYSECDPNQLDKAVALHYVSGHSSLSIFATCATS